jgi:hypothetical protein
MLQLHIPKVRILLPIVLFHVTAVKLRFGKLYWWATRRRLRKFSFQMDLRIQ